MKKSLLSLIRHTLPRRMIPGFRADTLLFLLCSISVPQQVYSAVIISPVSATASSETSPSTAIGNAIDQSGLSGTFISGTTDFDTYIGTNPTHSQFAVDEWISAPGVTSATLEFDLGGLFTIDRLAIWNEETAGVGTIDVLFSDNNIDFTANTSGITPTDTPLANYPAQVFSLTTASARYIKLNVSGCPQSGGNQLCAIGEIAFSATSTVVPVPAAAWLFGSGVLGLAGIARNRKQKQL